MSSQAPIPFDTTYYPLSVVTCLCFLALFKYVCPVLAKKIYTDFHTLPPDKQVYWHASVCSSVHAVIVSGLCLYSLLYQPQLAEDPVWADSPLVKSSCAIVVGYFAADTIVMMVYFKYIGDIKFLMHHFASVFAYYYVMSYGVYVYFANFRLMAEFSTPWVNNRWFLAVTNLKSSKWYIWNGLVLTGVFFLCRILSMPYCWYMIYVVFGTEAFIRSGFSGFVLVFSCLVLDFLNIVWFHKLCKGAQKTLQNLEASKSTENKTD